MPVPFCLSILVITVSTALSLGPKTVDDPESGGW
jgi:hypothetical protein